MRIITRKTWAALFAGAFVVLAAGATVEAQNAPGAKQPVSLRFSWKFKGEYGPLFAALDKGYFAEEGLDVKLNEGAGVNPALVSLAKGEDQISWMPAASLMQAKSKGVNAKIIASYSTAAPVVLVSWPDKPIHTPKDMEGKRIAGAAGDAGTFFMPILCRKNNTDCSKIQLINLALGAQVQAFINKQVDAIALYRTNDLPIVLSKYGHDFVLMDETKFGLVIPGGALVASDDVIAKDPAMLAKFVRATNRGMEFAKQNPLEAAKSMLKYWKASLEPEVVAEQIKAVVDGLPDYGGKPMGFTADGPATEALKNLKEAKMIDTILPLNEYYTNDIVARASAKTN